MTPGLQSMTVAVYVQTSMSGPYTVERSVTIIPPIIAHIMNAVKTSTLVTIAVRLAKKHTAVIAKSPELAKHDRKSDVVWHPASNNALDIPNGVLSDKFAVTTATPRSVASVLVVVSAVLTAE